MSENFSNVNKRQLMGSATVIGLLAVAIFLSRHLGDPKSELPMQLSCGTQSSPAFWDGGTIIFDFENGMMTTSAGRKKVYKADRVWREDGDQFMSIAGFLDVGNGTLNKTTDILRVSPTERNGGEIIRVKVSSEANPDTEPMQLVCLSEN
ncbi:hypothetical protein ABIB42_001072 [Massilia sp. UYP32]|uniref:hypothetical protein n=1 Tax=Massilia sp. UYP32 TaxID=1756386 RepID=UPI003D242551